MGEERVKKGWGEGTTNSVLFFFDSRAPFASPTRLENARARDAPVNWRASFIVRRWFIRNARKWRYRYWCRFAIVTRASRNPGRGAGMRGKGGGGGGWLTFYRNITNNARPQEGECPLTNSPRGMIFATRCEWRILFIPLRPPPFPRCVSPSLGLFMLLPVFLVLHTFIATSGVTWDWRHFFFFFLAEKPLHVSRTLSKQLRGRFALISLERMLRTWKVFRRCLSRKIQQIINSRWRGMRDARSKIAINFWRIWRMKI